MTREAKTKKNMDQGLLFVVLGLVIFGLAAVSSASAVISYERFGHNNYYFFRQLIFASIGIAAMYLVSRVDYRIWKKWSRPAMVLGIVILALVLVPSIGFKPQASARSWFRLGGFLLQPSEFVKILFIFYLSSWFERKKDAESNFWFGLLPPLLVSSVAIALVLLEPDLGTAAIFAAILMVIFFVAQVKLKYFIAVGLLGIAGLWAVIKTAPYRAARILTFLDPSLDPRGIGYHINQALLAIGSGGFWGLGYGKSLQKHNYLPEAIGDSIFAVMAEELGFVRITILILVFAAFIFFGLRVSRRAPDKFSAIAAAGITAWIGIQAIVNIGAISGLLPLTGITLPFVSYGGSSLISSLLGVGVLLNISRHRV